MDQVSLEDLIAHYERAPILHLCWIALYLSGLSLLAWTSVRAVSKAPTPRTKRARKVFLSICWLLLVLSYGGMALVLVCGAGLPAWSGLAQGPLLVISVASGLLWTANPIQHPK